MILVSACLIFGWGYPSCIYFYFFSSGFYSFFQGNTETFCPLVTPANHSYIPQSLFFGRGGGNKESLLQPLFIGKRNFLQTESKYAPWYVLKGIKFYKQPHYTDSMRCLEIESPLMAKLLPY